MIGEIVSVHIREEVLRDGRLDAFQIDEGVKALFATGLFADVRPRWEGGRLIVTTPDHSRLLRLRLALSQRAFEEHWSDVTIDAASVLRERAPRAPS